MTHLHYRADLIKQKEKEVFTNISPIQFIKKEFMANLNLTLKIGNRKFFLKQNHKERLLYMLMNTV